MRLNETQLLFARTMLDEPGAVTKTVPELAEMFTAKGECLAERLGIYRNNIVGSLTNSLLATYPLIKALTGEEFAKTMLRSFVLKNPPSAACLSHYGAGLPEFIENFTPAARLPYLPDVARLEWAMNEAYYAADDYAMTPEDMQQALRHDLTEATLSLRPSVQLLDSRWPLASIRDFCLRQNENSDETLDLDEKGGPLMIYRPAFTVVIIRLDMSSYHFLQSSKRNTLGTALAETLTAHPDFDFQHFLQGFLKLEIFSGLA